MINFMQIPKKQKTFFYGIVCLLVSMVSSGQVTETYTIQTSNFDASHTTNTNSNYFAGAYNNNGSEIGTYANGSGGGYTGDPGVSIFRSFTDDGTSTSGSSRDLQVGDEFKITAYVGNNTAFFGGSDAGISFNNGTTDSTFSNYNANQRLKLQIEQGNNWFVAGAAAAEGFAAPGQDVTLTFKVTSSNTVNVDISRANTNPQTGATTSELELSGSGAIQSFSIWNQSSGNGNNMFWKNCSVESTGTVELGGNNQTNSLTTISGIISNGLDANSTSSVSVNSVAKNGSGTITLTEPNTYTGSTSVNSGELAVSGSGTLGSSSAVTVSSGAVLRIRNSVTIASLDNSGTLEVDPGASLIITGNLSSSGTITINADGNGYGQVKVEGTISNSGTITQEQYISSTGHHGISSPMTTGFSTTSGTASSLYEYDASSSGTYVGTYVGNGTASTSTVGRGFFAPVGNSGDFLTAIGEFSVTGTPNTSHDWTLSYVTNSQSGASDNGWNLIGNPYSATLDWNSVSLGSSVNGAIYVWDPANSQYMSWTTLGGVNGGSQYIPPMQAFWVQTTSGGTGTAYDVSTTMSSNTLTTQSPTFQKSQNDILRLSVLDLTDTSKSDETIIANVLGSKDGFDESIDAWKLHNDGGNPNIYSFHIDDKLAINAVDLCNPKVIPMGIDAPQSGSMFQLSLEQVVNADLYNVLLEDKHLNTFTDITKTTYSFQYGGWPNNTTRFNLHLSATNSIGVDEILEDNSYIYQHENQVFIHSEADLYTAYEIWAIDGRLIQKGRISTSVTKFTKPQTGLHIIKLIGNSNNYIIKSFLK